MMRDRELAEIVPETLPGVDYAKRRQIPAICAVYFALSATNTVLYIGSTKNLKQRIAGHHRTKDFRLHDCTRITWFACAENDRLRIETALVIHTRPLLNKTWETQLPRPGPPRPVLSFGQRVRQQRTWRKLSIEDVAYLSGLPYHTIVRIEMGKEREPRLWVAAKLACAIGCTVDYLAGTFEDATVPGLAPPSVALPRLAPLTQQYDLPFYTAANDSSVA